MAEIKCNNCKTKLIDLAPPSWQGRCIYTTSSEWREETSSNIAVNEDLQKPLHQFLLSISTLTAVSYVCSPNDVLQATYRQRALITMRRQRWPEYWLTCGGVVLPRVLFDRQSTTRETIEDGKSPQNRLSRPRLPCRRRRDLTKKYKHRRRI